ncbi:MAG: hypothetical protein HZB91_04435 [Elusimicrobia bacterium]|nr:hypothetical protein [Elusimicrobiota bacterium]
MNYINSILDLSTSDDDESFFSAFAAFNAFRYDTHMTMSDGYRAVDVAKAGTYSGLNFGYRGIFEVYAKMFLPILPGMRMQYANFYTDYVIPYRPHEQVGFYAGLGFNAGGYNAPDVMYGGGLGLHPRIGVSYEPQRSHYFRLNLIPHMFWNEVITKDPSRSDMPKEYYDLRFASQSFGDNFGAELIHRHKYSKRWFIQTMLDFSHVTEPAGDYIELKPDNSTVSIHRPKESSEMIRLDLSLNYQF